MDLVGCINITLYIHFTLGIDSRCYLCSLRIRDRDRYFHPTIEFRGESSYASTSSNMPLSTSPLVNLVQAIHLPSHKFLLATSPSETSLTKVALHLFAHTPKSDGSRGGSENGSADGLGVGVVAEVGTAIVNAIESEIVNGVREASASGSREGSREGSRGGSSTGNSVGYGADGNRLPAIIVWEGEIDLEDPAVSPQCSRSRTRR